MKTNVNKKSGKLFGLAAVMMLAAMMIRRRGIAAGRKIKSTIHLRQRKSMR